MKFISRKPTLLKATLVVTDSNLLSILFVIGDLSIARVFTEILVAVPPLSLSLSLSFVDSCKNRESAFLMRGGGEVR